MKSNKYIKFNGLNTDEVKKFLTNGEFKIEQIREGDGEKVGYSLKTLIENDEKELTRNDIESFHKEIHILKKLSDESEGNNYLYIPKLYEWREYT